MCRQKENILAQNSRDWCDCPSADLFQETVNKVKIPMMVTNIQKGEDIKEEYTKEETREPTV